MIGECIDMQSLYSYTDNDSIKNLERHKAIQ
jgi:hypothetical protein